MPLARELGIVGESNSPKWSMTRPIMIWPAMGRTTVWTAPRGGNNRIFPVSATTPSRPPNQIHSGSPNAREMPNSPPVTAVAMTNKVNVPTANEMSEEENGVPVDARRRVLTKV